MHLNDIPEALCRQHVHGVDVELVEERHRVIDSRWKADFGGLADLALVTSSNVPFNVGFKGWLPEAVEKSAACRVEALVTKLVMSITDEGISRRGAGIKLVTATMLLPPKSTSGDKETVRSANEMSKCIGGKV